MDPSSVEGQPAEQLRAHEEFAAQGFLYLGWYHSHPGDTQPRPSEKDVQMQTEMQNQVWSRAVIYILINRTFVDSALCWRNMFTSFKQ